MNVKWPLLDFDGLPFAILEALVLLVLAAIIGWLLSRILVKRQVEKLREMLDEKKALLSEFRQLSEEPADQPVATNASKTVYPTRSPDHEPDNLQVIEGIGPKIEEILVLEGIHTFEQLAETSVIRIAGILKKAGPRFQLHDPSSWPRQAILARQEKWAELHAMQEALISGKNSRDL
jgi:predicted flap endonuclease-1-like 5' DNA nuclease